MDAAGDKPRLDAASVRVSIACSVVASAVVVFWVVEVARDVALLDFHLAATIGFFAITAILFARMKRHGIDGAVVAPVVAGIPALDSSKFPVGTTETFIVGMALAAAAMAIEYRGQAALARVSERKRKELEKIVRRSRRTFPWFVSIAFATGATWVAVCPPLHGVLWFVLFVVELLSVLASILDGVYVFYFGRVLDRLAAAERAPT